MTKVIDASVALKWFVAEAGSDDVAALFADGEKLGGEDRLVAPSLILLEVHYALAKRWNKQEVSFAQFAEAQVLLSVALEIEPLTVAACMEAGALSITADQVRGAPATARTSPFGIYDCVYISLAEALSGTLVTADAKQAKLAEAAGCAVMVVGVGMA
jgi:predicted nucleic acid-binding protein